jgi:signal transduction histidine kinase
VSAPPRQRPHHRPPWWPEGEAWPPRGRPPWARRGPPWRRPVQILALLLLLAVVASVILIIRAPLLGAAFVLVVWGLWGLALYRVFGVVRGRQRAEQARQKQLLADVAHELRTPLAVIRAQAEAIADGLYPADAEHLAPVLEATRTLERLVEDLRTLSLSEAGMLQPAAEPLDLRELLAEAAAAQRPAAGAAGVTLLVEGGPLELRGDPIRLRGVLDNLLTNALRHTPRGGRVRLSGRREAGAVVVEVSDSGSGIPAELLPRVFDRFTRGEGSPGSGLGLAIAREVVVAHGGSIAVESEPGRGATFTIRLPA